MIVSSPKLFKWTAVQEAYNSQNVEMPRDVRDHFVQPEPTRGAEVVDQVVDTSGGEKDDETGVVVDVIHVKDDERKMVVDTIVDGVAMSDEKENAGEEKKVSTKGNVKGTKGRTEEEGEGGGGETQPSVGGKVGDQNEDDGEEEKGANTRKTGRKRNHEKENDGGVGDEAKVNGGGVGGEVGDQNKNDDEGRQGAATRRNGRRRNHEEENDGDVGGEAEANGREQPTHMIDVEDTGVGTVEILFCKDVAKTLQGISVYFAWILLFF
jgi:hypothetical protein